MSDGGHKSSRSGSRRKSREMAQQVLYLLEFREGDVTAALQHFWRDDELDSRTVEFARDLILGTRKHKDSLDKMIDESSEHWNLNRMATIDRNIMRMAVFEFIHMPETPKRVVINEAIEIARRFSTEESTQFVNGILDNIRKNLEDEEETRDE